MRAGQTFLEVTDLVVVADDEVVDLVLVVAALPHGGEGVFTEKIRQYLGAVFFHVLINQVGYKTGWKPHHSAYHPHNGGETLG
ncbi:hypothetical protein GCM10027294_10040 [Marinactinospora endophytica]